MVHNLFTLCSLIVGTTIGAGMLSLPLLCQHYALTTILFVFAVSAYIMYQSAIYFVEIAAKYPSKANVITYVLDHQKSLFIQRR